MQKYINDSTENKSPGYKRKRFWNKLIGGIKTFSWDWFGDTSGYIFFSYLRKKFYSILVKIQNLIYISKLLENINKFKSDTSPIIYKICIILILIDTILFFLTLLKMSFYYTRGGIISDIIMVPLLFFLFFVLPSGIMGFLYDIFVRFIKLITPSFTDELFEIFVKRYDFLSSLSIYFIALIITNILFHYGTTLR
jgi:hypothetical protein